MSCLFACIIISVTLSAQQKTSVDTDGKPMLLGIHSPKELKRKPYSNWFKKKYNEYQSNDTIIPELKNALKGYSITVFLGSWCGDSKKEVPRLLKVLHKADFPNKNITLVFVDDHDSVYKQSPWHEEAGQYIYRVPVIMVKKNDEEKGRIVEHPVESLEKDLLKICNSENYLPTFTVGIDIWKKIDAGSINIADSANIISAYKNRLVKHSELNALGYVFLARKEYDKAITCFRINLLFFKDDANLWDSLADGLERVGRHEESITIWKKVLEIDPKSENAKKALGL